MEPSLSRPLTSCCETRLWSSSTTMTLTLDTVSCWPPKMTAKIEKNAMGTTKLNTSETRSRRRAMIAVRTMGVINRVTPFR